MASLEKCNFDGDSFQPSSGWGVIKSPRVADFVNVIKISVMLYKTTFAEINESKKIYNYKWKHNLYLHLLMKQK